MKCIRGRGFLSCPLGAALAAAGVLTIAAVQWPLALALFCKADSSAAVEVEMAPAPRAAAEHDAQLEHDQQIPAETNWRSDLTAALENAAAQDKPVLAYFTAEWCPPCQIMKREVWPREVGSPG